MVFKHFACVFFTTSTITPYSVVNKKHNAIYGVRVLFEEGRFIDGRAIMGTRISEGFSQLTRQAAFVI